MTIQDVLLYPDFEIIKSGAMVLLIAKEYKRITGCEPSACDCQLKNYLRIIRKHYEE